jgi:acyl-CoA synthetase (AMP-forming)/AMP-acid ligase II/acyl carrier protein
VIEAYGMTEAAHQMASNPLPPGIQKAGSVGLPAGPEIGIMAVESGKILPTGRTGEIVIRGQNVTLGYQNNADANKASFSDGWFRTGDQGYFDPDGYLFISGRIKELINRGGEKISPREIDEIILNHPAVEQAVTFGIPDADLGETVAVAVVLNKDTVDESDLRRYAATRLAPFKVPQRVIILKEIPKGPTGKIQRVGMAKKLGLEDVDQTSPLKTINFIAPHTETEKTVAKIWQEILNIPKVGIKNTFRDLGGDSMLATLVHMRLEDTFDIKILLVDLFAASTVLDQAALITKLMQERG